MNAARPQTLAVFRVLPIALDAADLALTLGVLLAVGHRRQLRLGPVPVLAGAPGRVRPFRLADHSDCAALLGGGTEHDLAFVAAAFLCGYVISFCLCLFVRAEAVFAGAFVVSQRSVS